MKYLVLLAAAFVFMSSDCKNKGNDKPVTGKTETIPVPACVQQLIDEAGKTSPPATPLQVDEYLYKEKKAYLFTADCCDFYNIVYDENCKRLCAPSGGFTGGGDGQCKDFDSTARLVKNIWKYTPKK